MKRVQINLNIAGIIMLILLVVAGIFIWKTIGLNRDVDSLVNAVNQKDQKIHSYEIKVDSLTEKVYEANLWVLTKDIAMKKAIAESERIKALHLRDVKVIGELNIRINRMSDSLVLLNSTLDTVPVVPVVVDGETKNMVEVPFFFGDKDAYSHSLAMVTGQGLGSIEFAVDSLPLNIVLGSRGVFRKSYVSDVTTPVPYVSVDKNNFTLVQKNPATPYIVAGTAGVVIGAGLILLLSLAF